MLFSSSNFKYPFIKTSIFCLIIKTKSIGYFQITTKKYDRKRLFWVWMLFLAAQCSWLWVFISKSLFMFEYSKNGISSRIFHIGFRRHSDQTSLHQIWSHKNLRLFHNNGNNKTKSKEKKKWGKIYEDFGILIRYCISKFEIQMRCKENWDEAKRGKKEKRP